MPYATPTKILDSITSMSGCVAKSKLSIVTVTGMATSEMIATMSCSRLSVPLYFLISKYVDKFPRPMPARIRYWYSSGKAPIAIKGPAQQIPFSAFALIGHLMLIFILPTIAGTALRKCREYAPKTAPKLTIQIIT
ncbi:MAG: hypothetical protein M3239_07595 [Thermoproteota archaeon]|nr:hypothetical protein [Thermoproteota archaeon]